MANHHAPAVRELLDALERETVSPRQIALLRIRSLQQQQDNNNGLAATLIPVLTEAVSDFVAAVLTAATATTTSTEATDDASISSHEKISMTIREAHSMLRRVLQLHLHLVQQDPALGEELGRQGSHVQLAKVMHCSFQLITDDDDGITSSSSSSEPVEDLIMELQDIACEIAATSRHFPVQAVPFTVADLKARLPLVFEVAAAAPPKHHHASSPPVALEPTSKGVVMDHAVTVLIHQVSSRQSAQVDVGFGTKKNDAFPPRSSCSR
jgi:hypothetical protein